MLQNLIASPPTAAAGLQMSAGLSAAILSRLACFASASKGVRQQKRFIAKYPSFRKPQEASRRFGTLSCTTAADQLSSRTEASIGAKILPIAAQNIDIAEETAPAPTLRPAYLDYQATTPLDPRVLDAMMPYQVDSYGNPHSRTHAYGWEAEEAVDKARQQIADLIGASSAKEIIFTSGATESNNLALKGIAGFYGDKKRHLITTQIEHKCVLASCRHLEDVAGFDVTYLPVKSDGLIDLNELEAAIRADTALVSIMFVNNEIGVIQDLKKIGQICKEKGVLFHTDAAQGAGKIPLNVQEWNVDLLSISGHKIYGPKGIGALYVRQRRPRVRLMPLMSGGGQERGLRSGTAPAFLCVGLGAACELARKEMANDLRHVEKLEKLLLNSITQALPKVTLNGSVTSRYHGNVNLSFTAVEGESLLMSLNNIAISSGSACTSASLEPSYVLRALGVGEDQAHTSLRFGIGRFTTEEEVRKCIASVVENVTRLREMSPLWGDETKPVWT